MSLPLELAAALWGAVVGAVLGFVLSAFLTLFQDWRKETQENKELIANLKKELIDVQTDLMDNYSTLSQYPTYIPLIGMKNHFMEEIIKKDNIKG